MILNIIMVALLYIFTLYFIVVGNLIYMMPWEFIKDPTNPIFIVLVHWLFILFAYLLYVLFHWVYKKRIHKNYMYSYLAFFPLFIVFYFGYYIQYDKWEFIPESIFETRLQNIEVADEENWMVQLWKLYTENDRLTSIISNLEKDVWNYYRCITWKYWKKCEEENLEDTLKLYNLEIDTIETINKNFWKIIKYEYFKEEIDGKFVSLRGLTSLSRISLFSVISKLEEWSENEAIEILLIYRKLWEKLLLWDTSLIWMIVWLTIELNSINNINYILDNYNLTDNNLNLLKKELNITYDSQDIFANAMKIEYLSNKYWIEVWYTNWTIRSSMLFNTEELYNIFRKVRLRSINWEGNHYDTLAKNYFKRKFIYRMFTSMSSISTQWYKESIENINIKSKELLEKIEVKEIKSNEIISKDSWYYYKSIVAEEKEFTFNKTLENNDFLYKQANKINIKYIRWDRPICPWMPNKNSCVKEWYWNIFNRYIIWENIYDLIGNFQNRDKYYIFKNDQLIFEDTIEMVWAWSPYMAYELDNKLLFIYTKNKGDDTVLYNVLYDEENINKKYEFKNIDWYFRYKWKEWFIVDKTKLFFDWKFLPYTFDLIQNRACCTSPSLFNLYDNWILVFANKRINNIDDLGFDLIEIDLNDYLWWY